MQIFPLYNIVIENFADVNNRCTCVAGAGAEPRQSHPGSAGRLEPPLRHGATHTCSLFGLERYILNKQKSNDIAISTRLFKLS